MGDGWHPTLKARLHNDAMTTMTQGSLYIKASAAQSFLYFFPLSSLPTMFDQLKNFIRHGRHASQSSSTERKAQQQQHQQQQLGPDRLEAVERLIKERKTTNNDKSNNESPHEHIQQRYQLSDKLGE